MPDDFTLHVITSDGGSLPQNDPTGQFEGHSRGLSQIFRKEKPISADRLVESWRNTNQVIVMMMNDAKKQESDGGLTLKEIEVTLSVSAEGNIGFVAGKAEAGIVLKFSR